MEKIVRIKAQGKLMKRDWTDKKGEIHEISSVELLLSDGIDTFVAELSDQAAITAEKQPLSQDLVYGVRCKMDVNSSKTDGTRNFNKIKIINIVPV